MRPHPSEFSIYVIELSDYDWRHYGESPVIQYLLLWSEALTVSYIPNTVLIYICVCLLLMCASHEGILQGCLCLFVVVVCFTSKHPTMETCLFVVVVCYTSTNPPREACVFVVVVCFTSNNPPREACLFVVVVCFTSTNPPREACLFVVVVCFTSTNPQGEACVFVVVVCFTLSILQGLPARRLDTL